MMMNASTSRIGVAVVLVVLVSLVSIATCDIDKDKEKCANDLVGLAPCLQYVTVGGDQSKSTASPPSDCCAGLKQVLQKSPECICLLVKDRNDPALGFKINATRALGLPSQCHAPANISACPAVLHLAPNSPDAKVFEDFANIGKKGGSSNSTTPSSADSAAGKAGGSGALTSTTTSGGGEIMAKRSAWGVAAGIQLVLLTLLLHHPLPFFTL